MTTSTHAGSRPDTAREPEAQPGAAGVDVATAGRYLCVCADDFGMSDGINAAVLDLADRGKISATGCMVLRAAWTSGVVGLRGLRGLRASQFDVGLHLDLSPPDPGTMSEPGLGVLILKSYLRLLRPERVRAEIRDQLARFEDELDRAPAFVDGHRHVHQFPVVREMLTKEIVHRYGESTPWIRNTEPLAAHGFAISKADVVFALGGARLLALANARKIPMSRRMLGVYDFAGTTDDYRQRLQGWIANCRSGDVLMCHPSRGSPNDPFDAARQQEYEVLRGTMFPVQALNGTVYLSPLSHLLRAGHPSPA